MPMSFPKDKDQKLNFRRNLVKHHKFVGYLDEWMASEPEGFEYKHEVKKPDDAWHPSGHCTPTVTELHHFTTHSQIAKNWGCAMNKSFAVGHFWHQLLQYGVLQMGLAKPEDIEREGMKVWEWYDPNPPLRETAPKPYHWAKGAGDLAPLRLPEYGEYVVDFKTMNSRSFKSEGIPRGFEEKYEAQINIYMNFFDLEKALIVGINKDTPHDFKEIEFVRNQPLIDAVYRKWEFVSECIDVGESPSTLDDDHFSLDGLFQGPIVQ